MNGHNTHILATNRVVEKTNSRNTEEAEREREGVGSGERTSPRKCCPEKQEDRRKYVLRSRSCGAAKRICSGGLRIGVVRGENAAAKKVDFCFAARRGGGIFARIESSLSPLGD